MESFVLDTVLVLLGIGAFFYIVPLGLLREARDAGIKLDFFSVISMRLRRIEPAEIIRPLIKAANAGIKLDISAVKAHHLAKGHVQNLADALIEAHLAQVPLEFNKAAEIDLAGRDILKEVRGAVNPRILNTPVLTVAANDGVQVRAKCAITVKTNLDRLLGGAGEATIIARVGEALVTRIRKHDHKEIQAYSAVYVREMLQSDLDRCAAMDITGIEITVTECIKNL